MKFLKKIKLFISKKEKEKHRIFLSQPYDTTVRIDGVAVKVGKFTYGVGNIELAHHKNAPQLSIGRFCSIAGNVRIFTGANHRSDWMTSYPFGTVYEDFFGSQIPVGFPHSKGPVSIGNDVWIGNSVTIMSGVNIGDGSILATNAHIIKDVKPYEIVGGNPANHIKFRYPQDTIELLLELEWWNLDEAKIKKIHPLLTAPADNQVLEKIISEIKHRT